MAFINSIKENLKNSIEMASGGKNTVLFDDLGNPSIMVKIPKFKISDVIPGGSNTTHPAFIVNGVEKDFIYISKYQNVVSDNRAYSLPGKDPKTSISFDQAITYCKNKGNGWHLMTNAEWAAIALWCKRNECMPRGNNNFGSSIENDKEFGVETSKDNAKTGRVATGTGPISWSHDGTSDGIYDLNGNIWELNSGMRILDGEIQIIPDNNASILNADHSLNSPLWKAIKLDGSLVAPGTAGTLKFNTSMNINTVKGPDINSAKLFESISGVAPEILKSLTISPYTTGLGDDIVMINTKGESLSIRGATFADFTNSGMFALAANLVRSTATNRIGFRSVFIQM